MPYLDPSCPRTDCFTPPKGHSTEEISPSLTPSRPTSSCSATLQIWSRSVPTSSLSSGKNTPERKSSCSLTLTGTQVHRVYPYLPTRTQTGQDSRTTNIYKQSRVRAHWSTQAHPHTLGHLDPALGRDTETGGRALCLLYRLLTFHLICNFSLLSLA